MRSSRLNYLLYQTGWCACVFGAVSSHPGLGAAAGAILTGLHVTWAQRRSDELVLVLAAVLTGLAVDGAQIYFGRLEFPAQLARSPVPPAWLLVMWAQFGSTLRFSLRWISARSLRALAFGGLGGPLAYLGGARLDAVCIAEPVTLSLLGLSVLWALAVPGLAALARAGLAQPGAGLYR